MIVVQIGEGYYEETPNPDGYGYRKLNKDEVKALLLQITQQEAP